MESSALARGRRACLASYSRRRRGNRAGVIVLAPVGILLEQGIYLVVSAACRADESGHASGGVLPLLLPLAFAFGQQVREQVERRSGQEEEGQALRQLGRCPCTLVTRWQCPGIRPGCSMPEAVMVQVVVDV